MDAPQFIAGWRGWGFYKRMQRIKNKKDVIRMPSRNNLEDCLMNRKAVVSVLVTVFVMVGLASPAIAQASSDAVLILHFDEGSGTIAKDASGHGNDGTIHGATWTTGISGKALRFDGVDDYVKITNHPSLNPRTAITISAWYRPVSFKGTGNDPIVDKGYYSHDPPYYQYHLGVTGDGYNHRGARAAFGFSVAVEGESKGAGTDYNFWIPGTWYHLVGTYDGEMIRFYVNGKLISAKQSQGEMRDYGKDVYIATFSNLVSTYHLPGTIDEVRIYNRALRIDEIKNLYESLALPTERKPSIELTKSASPSTIQEGETTTISIRVENTGAGDAKSVEVIDTIPTGFKIISGSKSASFDEIKPNEYRTYQYTLKAIGTGRFVLDPATATYSDDKGNSYSSASNSVTITSEASSPPIVPTEEEKGIPGFEGVFAIAGLLAVAYLLRRRK